MSAVTTPKPASVRAGASATRAAALAPDAAAASPEELLAGDLLAVRTSIARLTDGPATRITRAAQHTLFGGGKHARPLLTCAMMRALGEDPRPVIDLVAVVELAHVGSLLHDDVVDGGQTRRGRVAAHLAFDAHTAILAGDCLLSWTMHTLACSGPRAVQVAMTRAICDLAAGEALERERLFDATVEVKHVREVHRLKTAALFAYAAEAGALLAGASTPVREAARTFGEKLGLAFQGVDDLLDWRGDKGALGKPIGRDFNEGVVNLPLAMAMAADNGLRALVAELWRPACRATTTVEGLKPERLEQTGAFNQTGALATADCDAACAALNQLPASAWRDTLCDTAQRSLRRRV